MSRNLVVCLDGTSNQVRGRGDTNVVRLYRVLDLSDPGVQVGYYDPGVGTFASGAAWTPAARWLSRTAGLAFGAGMRQNVGEAYTWLMQQWRPGDRVFVFGFSRGAYTARALLGMIRQIGLLRPGSENLVPYAVAEYASRSGDLSEADWREVHRFADTFAQEVEGRTSIPVAFVGLWDTVKAAGFLNWDVHWAWTVKIPYNVAAVRHAVAIDETRRPYREYLLGLERPEATAAREAWFAGVHSDVGGTFDDSPGLSTIALRWVVEGAVEAQLRIRPRRWESAAYAVTAASATGPVHRADAVWKLVGSRTRPIPAGASVHASVRDRMAALPAYRPALPVDVVWEDDGWAGRT